jgi:hypothetical protein
MAISLLDEHPAVATSWGAGARPADRVELAERTDGL